MGGFLTLILFTTLSAIAIFNFFRKKKIEILIADCWVTQEGVKIYALFEGENNHRTLLIKDHDLPDFAFEVGQKIVLVSAGFSTKFEKLP